MDFEKIGQLVTAIMSALAILISIIRRNKKNYTYEEIEEKEEERKLKRIAKRCKKAKIDVDTNTKSQNDNIAKEDYRSDAEEIKQVGNITFRS